MEKTDLLGAVKAHAVAHYEEGGWDILVECWDDARILDAIGGAATAGKAVAKVGKILKDISGVWNDIAATAF